MELYDGYFLGPSSKCEQWYHLIIQEEGAFIKSHHYINENDLNRRKNFLDLPLEQVKELKKTKKIYFNGSHYILTKLPHEFVFKS